MVSLIYRLRPSIIVYIQTVLEERGSENKAGDAVENVTECRFIKYLISTEKLKRSQSNRCVTQSGNIFGYFH